MFKLASVESIKTRKFSFPPIGSFARADLFVPKIKLRERERERERGLAAQSSRIGGVCNS
jgi:hypothetical protein